MEFLLFQTAQLSLYIRFLYSDDNDSTSFQMYILEVMASLHINNRNLSDIPDSGVHIQRNKYLSYFRF